MSAQATVAFHARNAVFHAREQFTDMLSGLLGYALYPFYTWLMARIWLRFNSYQGNFRLDEVLLYVGVGELLFMTILRPAQLGRAFGDFSITLSRPRSWLGMQLSGQFGKILCNRLIHVAVLVAVLPWLGPSLGATLAAAGRTLLILAPLTLAGALINIVFSSARVMWEETTYFALPFSKIFLVLGGVVSPLNDYGSPWREWLIRLPASDLFFQPAYFAVRGEFYGMSAADWSARMAIEIAALLAFNAWLFSVARRHHRSYGG